MKARVQAVTDPYLVTEGLYNKLVEYTQRNLGAIRRWVEAEDLVQQVLVEYHIFSEMSASGMPRVEQHAWLYQRLQWRMASVLRKHSRMRGETEMGGLDLADGKHGTEGVVTRADTRRMVLELISALPPSYASVVRLCALEERTSEEAASELGLTVSAVRKRYGRARAALADRLNSFKSG